MLTSEESPTGHAFGKRAPPLVTERGRPRSSSAPCRARLRSRWSRRARCRRTRRLALGSAWPARKPRIAGSQPRWLRCTRRPWPNRLPRACSARIYGTRRCSRRRTLRRSRHTCPSSSKRWISRSLARLRRTRRLWRRSAPRPCRPWIARNPRWRRRCNDRSRRCIGLASRTGSSASGFASIVPAQCRRESAAHLPPDITHSPSVSQRVTHSACTELGEIHAASPVRVAGVLLLAVLRALAVRVAGRGAGSLREAAPTMKRA